MSVMLDLPTAIENAITRLIGELRDLDQELDQAVTSALEDWLITTACEDYDTIDLNVVLTEKVWRKQFKHLREMRRNLEKMIAALRVLQDTAHSPAGEKLQKKFEAEQERFQP